MMAFSDAKDYLKRFYAIICLLTQKIYISIRYLIDIIGVRDEQENTFEFERRIV